MGTWKSKSRRSLAEKGEDLSLVAKIEANTDDNSQNEGIKLLPKLLRTMSQYLTTTRNTEMGHRNLLQRLQNWKQIIQTMLRLTNLV